MDSQLFSVFYTQYYQFILNIAWGKEFVYNFSNFILRCNICDGMQDILFTIVIIAVDI